MKIIVATNRCWRFDEMERCYVQDGQSLFF